MAFKATDFGLKISTTGDKNMLSARPGHVLAGGTGGMSSPIPDTPGMCIRLSSSRAAIPMCVFRGRARRAFHVSEGRSISLGRRGCAFKGSR